MDEKDIQAYVKQGFLRAAVIFEVVGKPKEHVEKTVKQYVEKIKKESDIKILNEAYDEANEVKDDFFSAPAELEILVENVEKLTWLCVNFNSSS